MAVLSQQSLVIESRNTNTPNKHGINRKRFQYCTGKQTILFKRTECRCKGAVVLSDHRGEYIINKSMSGECVGTLDGDGNI